MNNQDKAKEELEYVRHCINNNIDFGLTENFIDGEDWDRREYWFEFEDGRFVYELSRKPVNFSILEDGSVKFDAIDEFGTNTYSFRDGEYDVGCTSPEGDNVFCSIEHLILGINSYSDFIGHDEFRSLHEELNDFVGQGWMCG